MVLAIVLHLLTGCYDIEGERSICNYKVQIRYYYNRENTSAVNMLERYVSTIDEYIFDSDGILYAINSIVPDPCGDGIKSELDLPYGRYSVIAWGNRGDYCKINDYQPGVTTRDQMLIMMNNPCVDYPGYQDNGDRLYYGYRTFRVERGRTTRVHVDVTHSHLSLRMSVRWRNSLNAPKAENGEMQIRLGELPSEYAFMPEYLSRRRVSQTHVSVNDEYLVEQNETIHYIPRNYTDFNIVKHRVNSNINVDRQISCELVTFRLRNNNPAIVSLYQLTADGDIQLMHDVPLGDYFAQMNENLDISLRQEYELEFVINDDGSVTVLPVDISDWDEGGALGYD